MGRIIYNQTIATTHVDRSGDRIDPDLLRGLHAQMPDPWASAAHHDMAAKPPCILHRPRIVEMEDGELAIVGDVEVLDEEAFAKAGGFSIAFSRHVFRVGDRDDDHAADIRITVNPEQFDAEVLALDLRHDVDALTAIDVVERIEKQWGAAETIALIALGFQLSENEHVKRLVAKAFRRVRAAQRIDSKHGSSEVQLHISLPDGRQVLLLRADLNVDAAALDHLDHTALRHAVEMELAAGDAMRIVGRVRPDGTIAFEFVVLRDGSPRPPNYNPGF